MCQADGMNDMFVNCLFFYFTLVVSWVCDGLSVAHALHYNMSAF